MTFPHRFARQTLLMGVALITLTGCRERPTVAGGASEAVSALEVPGVADGVVEAHFEVAPRSVPDADANAALAALGLDTPNARLSWDSREGGNGNYVFSGVELREGEAVRGRMAELEVLGLRSGGAGDGVRLDKLVASDVEMQSDPEEGASLAVNSLVLVDAVLNDLGDLGADGVEIDVELARAVAAEGLVLSVDNAETIGRVEIDTLAFADARDPEDADGFLRLGKVDLEMMDVSGEVPVPMTLELDGAAVTGLSQLDSLSDGGLDRLGLSGGLPFATADVGALAFGMDTLRIEGEGLQVSAQTRGDTTTQRMALQPLSVRFDGTPASPDLAPVAAQVTGLGYEALVFSGKGETVIDTKRDVATSRGGFFGMEDGFRLEVDSEVLGGMAARRARMEALRAVGPAPDFDTASPEELDAYFEALSAAGAAGQSEMKFGELVVRLTDRSVMDRAINMVAEQQGVPPFMVRMQAKGALALGGMFGADTGVDGEIVSEAAKALGDFIDTPGSTLVIGIRPDTPVPANEMNGASKARLGFTANVTGGDQ